MGKNSFITFLAAGVIILAVVVMDGNPVQNVEPVADQSPSNMIQEFPIEEAPVATPTRFEEYLVGIWQDMPMMGSGWSDHYNFYPDGHFAYYVSQMKCDKRTIRQTGGWILEGNKLVLTTTREQVMVGGKLVKSIGSCGTPLTLEDGQLTERELPKPIVETLVITQREPSEDSFHESIDMGKTQFWKFDTDPSGRGEFDVEN